MLFLNAIKYPKLKAESLLKKDTKLLIPRKQTLQQASGGLLHP